MTINNIFWILSCKYIYTQIWVYCLCNLLSDQQHVWNTALLSFQANGRMGEDGGGRRRAHRSTTNQQSAGYLGPTGFCLFAKANMGCESHIKQSKWGVCQSSDSSLWKWSFLFFSTSRKSSWKNTSERYSDIQSQSWNRGRKDIRQMLLQITSCFTHSSLTGESATTLKEKENPFSLWQSESVALSLPGMPRISFHYLSSPNHKHGDAEQLHDKVINSASQPRPPRSSHQHVHIKQEVSAACDSSQTWTGLCSKVFKQGAKL